MKTSTEDRSELISGIRKDAMQEAERIVADAEKTAADKKLAKEMQLSAIERDAAKKIEQQTAVIEKNNVSAISVERKRIALKIRERIINNVIDRVREKIRDRMGKPDYPEIVRGWILEAAIGLGEPEAVAGGSARELEIMTDAFLRDTEKKYNQLTGGRVCLVKSGKDPLFAQGVVLSSVNNKTAFNNQVPTRLLRYQAEIRKAIYREFFS